MPAEGVGLAGGSSSRTKACRIMGNVRRFEGVDLSSSTERGRVYIRAGISDIGLIWADMEVTHDP